MMSEWFSEFVQTNLIAPQPPPQQVSVVPQVIDPIQLNKPLVDKIRKYGAEEFRATANDDAVRAEFWLENTIRVFDEMSLTPDECIKCVISLLRDTAYNWWKTLKRKEFLELKQGRLSVTEYEREFVRLSQYAREYDSTEATMCKRFI
ncbi:DNA/RNA polymerases superfamily protein [Gossypium australe]|uniref:DNA/RNA polymerases superfamily protein n=1 Tax=Gossypium australe TaxID=47621 RepID=A0A5B6WHK0_9ROSI|nr:DNA/RNA polymerases superfamily protein [Gossypium australe]